MNSCAIDHKDRKHPAMTLRGLDHQSAVNCDRPVAPNPERRKPHNGATANV